MARIQVSHLTFAYDGSYDNIFEDVSLEIDTDWKLGFIGRNGRGKTTFLRLLQGKYPYRGSIRLPVETQYFPFAVQCPADLTLDLLQSVCADAPLWRIQRELSLLEVREDVLYRPFSTLSNGERTKALLAALFLREHAFLLIDEPTNHLDARARRVVGRYLRAKKGFLLVSHDRAFLDGCIDHVLSINRSTIELQRGNYSSWAQNKAQRDAREIAQNQRLRKDIQRLSDSARRTADWSDRVERTKRGSRDSGLRPDRGHIGHKAAKMMKRSQGIRARRERAIDEKSKLLKDVERYETLRLHPLPYPGERMAELRDVCIAYGDTPVLKDLRLQLRRGERIAITGGNGCGKTSLLRLILGEAVPHTGEMTIANNLVVSYVPQDAASLCGDLRTYAMDNQIDETLFKTILRKLGFSRVQFEKDMRDFSDGQRKKALLARSLCQRAHLYIWDEPLNYIDILSRVQIEELLLQSELTMLFVEHDAAFVDRIATRTLQL